ncbi:PPC domain-containing protein OS=Ureibacillus acetophenoni OX=614649 GN=SAMN05877842_102193 PE=4 SV=1 [Ureibacillus acetophenoni]
MDNQRLQAFYDKTTERIVGRLKKDTDLFTGIKEVCKYFGVSAGQFQCLGSLKCATFLQVAKGDKEGLIKYSPKVQTTSEVEIISGVGFIGVNEQGELDVHFHGTVVDCDKKLDGGHFIEGENITAITVEFIILPLKDVVLTRKNDEIFNVPVFTFNQKEA